MTLFVESGFHEVFEGNPAQARLPLPPLDFAPHLLRLVFVGFIALGTVFQTVAENFPVSTESITSPLTNQPPPDLPRHLRHGFELAHIYCQACHLFPEPRYLTKAAWTNGALRLMALRVGAAKLNYDKHPDGKILKEAGVFPDQPLLSEQDWWSICSYFSELAPTDPLPQPPHPSIRSDLTQFRAKDILTSGGEPWTTLVKIDSHTQTLYLGDARTKSLEVLDSKGVRQTGVPLNSGPVSMVFKDNGAYLVLIGNIFPSDQLAGQIVFLSRTNGAYGVRTILDKLRRPTDVAFADLNRDGREDLIVSEFGSVLGALSWFENLGHDRLEQHLLLDRPGAIRACIPSTRKDGLPDFFVLMAQAREGIYAFKTDRQGQFDISPVAEFPPVWGCSGMQMVDFNNDGFPDLLVTNGDSGDYISPNKSFHGIRLYLNHPPNLFKEAWFYPLHGAFQSMAADFDGDGDLDIAAISFFPDYLNSPQESFVYLENRGNLQFVAHSMPEAMRGRWLTMDVGDVDDDGDLDIVLGSFINGPASIPIPASVRAGWKSGRVAALILENTLKQTPSNRTPSGQPPTATSSH